ncbi:MAG: sialate O-acetylesterase [Verrucomicrobiota bacterium]
MRVRVWFSSLGSVVLGAAVLCGPARGEEVLLAAPIFGNHMVLQRGLELPVWGVAEPGANVTVSFGGKEFAGGARDDGQWRVVLDAMEASTEAREMVVKSGDLELRFEDVLVGEVWLCSGQSNMAFKLGRTTGAEEAIAGATSENLRLNTSAGWSVASPESVPGFSGVAYYFGRQLEAELGVPVGLIARAAGGTPVEWWTPAAHLERVDFAAAAMKNPSDEWVAYEAAVVEWKAKVKEVGRKEAGKKPQPVGTAEEGVLAGIYSPGAPGKLWAQHFAPIAGFGIGGAIWYQGERNSKAGVEAAGAYRELLGNMITSWRESWGQGDFPFLAVQLPTFSGGGEGWKLVQEGQAAAVSDVSKAGYVDIRDLPDDGLHPKDKRSVGERLADLAAKEFVE